MKKIAIFASGSGSNAENTAPDAFTYSFSPWSFTNDLGADSLDTVELIMEFEKEFEISIPDEDAEKITTVGDAINYISAKK